MRVHRRRRATPYAAAIPMRPRVPAAWGRLLRCRASSMLRHRTSSRRLASGPTASGTRPGPILGQAPSRGPAGGCDRSHRWGNRDRTKFAATPEPLPFDPQEGLSPSGPGVRRERVDRRRGTGGRSPDGSVRNQKTCGGGGDLLSLGPMHPVQPVPVQDLDPLASEAEHARFLEGFQGPADHFARGPQLVGQHLVRRGDRLPMAQ